MKMLRVSFRFLCALTLLTSQVLVPVETRADSPAGFAIVASMYVAIPVAIAVRSYRVSTETETKETNTEQETKTDQTESSSGGESEEEPGESDAGLSSQAAAQRPKPIILAENLVKGGWFASAATASVYPNGIPTASAPRGSSSRKRARRVRGVGIELRNVSDNADVLRTEASIRRVSFRKVRASSFQIVRSGKSNSAVTVKVRIKADDLRATTLDLPGSQGAAQSTLSVLVDGVERAAYSVAVEQGQSPVFSSLPKGATTESRSDYGAIRGLDTEIGVLIAKGKRRATIELRLVTEGVGRKV